MSVDTSSLESIAAAGAEANERFVADCVAMDHAWESGTYDEWLADYRKRQEEECYGDDGATNGAAD